MQQQCSKCTTAFEVAQEDLEFYDKVSPEFAGKKFPIPPPTLCPECRFQRRMIWRREHSLYNRTCSLCTKKIVSIHAEDAPYPVYCLKCWWGDGWDPLAFGIPIDESRPFTTQFSELLQSVPQIAMMNDDGIGSQNCEYCQDFAFGKNCYLMTGSWEVEDCYYCDCNCLKSRHLFDCFAMHFSELVYESLSSQRLHRCAYMRSSENCHDCMLGVDLKGCKNCIACIALRQKEFCIFNKQYSKEEYEKEREKLKLNSYQGIESMKKRFEEWILAFPRRHAQLINCENCIGDDLFHCKNTFGFQFDGAEYCKFIIHGDAPKNSYDVSQTGRPEWCYEGATPDNSYMTHFTTWCWKDKYVLYSDNCHSCEHLFGCIGLKRKKYCIFNKQYTKEEYERLVPQIIERMQNDGGGAMNPSTGRVSGSWGEFFPMTLSPYCYNETQAHEHSPLTKEQVLALGLRWRDPNPKSYKAQTYVIPENIEDVSDAITEEILACVHCRKNFKILPQELAFHRDMRLPVPRKCYDCRYADRIKLRNPRRLWKRQCMKCSKEIHTSYSPERPEKIYCESCYLKAVY